MVKVIAEFCQNHNGDEKILQDMIAAAAENGATYAKIQSIYAEDIALRERFEEGVIENGIVKCIKRPYDDEFDRLQDLELSLEQEQAFINSCQQKNVLPMTTCFTRGSVARLAAMDWAAIKVASYDCASYPMLRELCQKFKTVIVSTGASYDDEIKQASQILKSAGVDYALLHCVTIYPTPMHELHLRRMSFLKQFAEHVGLSSHPLNSRDGVKADLVAIYLGAEYLERHFTVLKPDQSRDGPVSITGAQLKEIIDFSKLARDDQKAYIDEHIPEFEEMLGHETRELSAAELLNRDYYRGRFATHVGDKVIFNWEDKAL